MEALLSLDLGTTGCKAAVYTTAGRVCGTAYLEYGLIHLDAERVEQDAHEWWRLSRQALRQAVDASRDEGCEIRALSVSSQGISFVPLDAGGQPLRNALTWLDTRAMAQAERIAGALGEPELFRLTGKRPSPVYVLAKLLWLREHEPDLFRQTSRFLMAHDFILYRLCGAPATDYSLAGGTLLLDVSRLEWSETLLTSFDLEARQLPELHQAGTVVGELDRRVAEELGLDPHTRVVVGGQDQKCAALGAAIGHGRATVSLGTSSAISCLVERPVLDPQRRIPTFPFVVSGYWDLEAVVSTAGAALKWFRENLFPGLSYAELDRLAQQSPPGAHGTRFYPHLTGATSPAWREQARGAISGLSLATGVSDLARSVLEGIAFQLRANLEVMEPLAPARELVLFGGGAHSDFWADLICQITQRPVWVTENVDVAGWGAAILAGVGAGLYPHPFQAPGQEFLRLVAEPDPARAAQYADLYAEYREAESHILQVGVG